MLINWFTVGAQIANFLILVVLLKIFLYDRIIAAMDKREESIRNRMEEADQKKEAAEEEAEKYRQKKDKLENERRQTLAQAKTDAEQRRKALMREIRAEVADLRNKWQKSVAKDKQAFLSRLRRMAGRQVYDIAGKVLADLTNADLEKELIRNFANRLADVSGERRQSLIVNANKNGLSVISGFEMSSADRGTLTRKIHETMSQDIAVDYETDPELPLDIALKTAGHRFSWGINDYLDRLEQSAREIIEEETRKENAEETADTSGESENDGKQETN